MPKAAAINASLVKPTNLLRPVPKEIEKTLFFKNECIWIRLNFSMSFSFNYILFLTNDIFMNDRIIEFDPLIEGVLIKRYKRFLADIKLENGEVVTAHCANTGPMKGLLSEGAKVRISVSPSPKRKLPFTWEQICVCLLYTSPSPRD